MVWLSMIHRREFQERAWDPGIVVVGSSVADIDGKLIKFSSSAFESEVANFNPSRLGKEAREIG